MDKVDNLLITIFICFIIILCIIGIVGMWLIWYEVITSKLIWKIAFPVIFGLLIILTLMAYNVFIVPLLKNRHKKNNIKYNMVGEEYEFKAAEDHTKPRNRKERRHGRSYE